MKPAKESLNWNLIITGLLFLIVSCRLWGESGGTPTTFDSPNETSIAIEVGETRVTFFELAQLLKFSRQKGAENEQGCDFNAVNKALELFIQDTIDAELSRICGICDSDTYKYELAKAKRFLLWQDFSKQEDKGIINSQELECDSSGDCLIIFPSKSWAAIAKHFSIPFVPPTGANQLVLQLNGNVHKRLHEIVSNQLRMKPRPPLQELFNAIDDPKSPLINWMLGTFEGNYTMKEFAEDYNTLLLKKMSYTPRELITLIFDQFFARKYFEQAQHTGLIEEKSLVLGFPTYGRRHARSEYYKLIRSKIDYSDETSIRQFFLNNYEDTIIPERFEIAEYSIPKDTPEEMARHLHRTFVISKDKTMMDPIENNNQLSIETKTVTVNDPQFSFLLKNIKNIVTPLEISDQGYSFKKILKAEGEQTATFELMRDAIEQKWEDLRFSEKRAIAEKKYRETHSINLYPNLEEIICSDFFDNLKLDHVRKRENKNRNIANKNPL